MMREKTAEFKKILKERMEDIGKCELCGSKRGLELHHCIPYSLGGEDTEDNLILVCSTCHSKLTPHSTLTKIGLRNRVFAIKMNFYNKMNEILEAGEVPNMQDVFDFFEEIN